MSGSANPSPFVASTAQRGEMVNVTSLASPGQAVHDPPADQSAYAIPGFLDTGLDLVRIKAYNNDTVARDITIQWTGAGPTQQMTVTLQPKTAPVLIVDDDQIGRDKAISAWASSAGVINLLVRRRPHLIPLH